MYISASGNFWIRPSLPQEPWYPVSKKFRIQLKGQSGKVKFRSMFLGHDMTLFWVVLGVCTFISLAVIIAMACVRPLRVWVWKKRSIMAIAWVWELYQGSLVFRNFPCNFVLLAIFTICESITVAQVRNSFPIKRKNQLITWQVDTHTTWPAATWQLEEITINISMALSKNKLLYLMFESGVHVVQSGRRDNRSRNHGSSRHLPHCLCLPGADTLESTFLSWQITKILEINVSWYSDKNRLHPVPRSLGGRLLCLLPFRPGHRHSSSFRGQHRDSPSCLRSYWRPHLLSLPDIRHSGRKKQQDFCYFEYLLNQMMMGGNHKFSISPEEYIFAAIAIYLDILNLFLHILKLVAAARKNWTILNFFLHILKIVAVERKTWIWVLKVMGWNFVLGAYYVKWHKGKNCQ